MSGPIQAASSWPAAGGAAVPPQQSQYQQQYEHQQQDLSYPAPQQVPIFQVTAMRHTGALVFWFNQRYVITGTYAQCDAALRSAQTHNYVFGWWSLLSILIMNWIALLDNASARKKLDSDAQQAQAYAQWWHQYIGPGRT